jgi:hypothetical protein
MMTLRDGNDSGKPGVAELQCNAQWIRTVRSLAGAPE